MATYGSSDEEDLGGFLSLAERASPVSCVLVELATP